MCVNAGFDVLALDSWLLFLMVLKLTLLSALFSFNILAVADVVDVGVFFTVPVLMKDVFAALPASVAWNGVTMEINAKRKEALEWISIQH